MSQKIIVIGGSAAGPKAAAKIKRLNSKANVSLIQKEAEFSMASCGYPYYVGGTFNDRNQLISTPTGVVRDSKFYLNVKDIDAHPLTEAIKIDREKKEVLCKNLTTQETYSLSYDKLVIATGATPRIPSMPGNNLKGITTLQSMKDADYLRAIRDAGKIKKAVIIGGGLIGIETCEALQLAGIEITVIEMLPQVLPFLDFELAKVLEKHIRSHASQVITNQGVVEFIGEEGSLTGVKLNNGTILPAELAVIAIGVIPNVALAKEAGLSIGNRGGMIVNEYLQTNDPSIYAVGDCIETKNRITNESILAPFGDLADLEARVAAQNIVLGNKTIFPGSFQTGICKVFDFSAGSTGISEKKAKTLGYDPIAVLNASTDKPFFMNGKLVISKLVAEKKTRKLLGFQCIGLGDVSRQISIASMALHGNLTLDEASILDLPYAPPFSLAIDHFIASAHILDNKIKGYLKSVNPLELKEKLDKKEPFFFLDLRGPDEYETMRFGLGETLIPLGQLRKRPQDLPQDKNTEIICFCKISLRAYEAQIFLESIGCSNVKILEGGIVTWPFAREK